MTMNVLKALTAVLRRVQTRMGVIPALVALGTVLQVMDTAAQTLMNVLKGGTTVHRFALTQLGAIDVHVIQAIAWQVTDGRVKVS